MIWYFLSGRAEAQAHVISSDSAVFKSLSDGSTTKYYHFYLLLCSFFVLFLNRLVHFHLDLGSSFLVEVAFSVIFG